MKLADLSVPLAALRLLAAEHPTLPAVDVDITPLFPCRLALCIHDHFGAFEAWRAALGISPESVTCSELSGGRTRALKAATTYAGADLTLAAYGDVAAPQVGEGR
ncbi:hypothetical protein [Streptomyces benahoarensis]|uniref:Uncharacterized protein n=1 Tax=Streptomyces benahoarensis TaxID=2595054 RepID=A0A553ZL92_9ACTN|nr:hypothetical protein [Streptomyces benahoarensis]TSB17691.1 hypothetical protein FNJ62_26800 [Streptomyces benahoarensis]TSB42163.1 hypothetical protein FNZ23_11355 [Streptomyces benahoarensis]